MKLSRDARDAIIYEITIFLDEVSYEELDSIIFNCLSCSDSIGSLLDNVCGELLSRAIISAADIEMIVFSVTDSPIVKGV